MARGRGRAKGNGARPQPPARAPATPTRRRVRRCCYCARPDGASPRSRRPDTTRRLLGLAMHPPGSPLLRAAPLTLRAELPEIEALAHHLRENAVYRPVARVDVGMSVLKTAAPPVSALVGRVVTGAPGREVPGRRVRRPAEEPLHLITHPRGPAGCAGTSAGRHPAETRARAAGAARPSRRGRRPGLRPHRGRHPEAPVGVPGRRPAGGPGIARLGPDAPDTVARRARGAARRTHRADQDPDRRPVDDRRHRQRTATRSCTRPQARLRAVAGRLKPEQIDDLHAATTAVLGDAVARSVGQGAATLKGEKRSGLRVHARTGLPCPVCGTRRCPSPIGRSSTVPAVRPVAGRSPTAGCPAS